MKIREGVREDAPAAAALLRRSISELCVADHGNDAKILADWLRNKTQENLEAWIGAPANSALVATESETLLAFGMVTDRGEITLNYVSPDTRFRGVSRAKVAALEARALAHGNAIVTLTSTKTARRFYRSAGYTDDAQTADAGGYPMFKRFVES